MRGPLGQRDPALVGVPPERGPLRPEHRTVEPVDAIALAFPRHLTFRQTREREHRTPALDTRPAVLRPGDARQRRLPAQDARAAAPDRPRNEVGEVPRAVFALDEAAVPGLLQR